MDDPEVGPRLREQFRGFTEYTNNIGTGDHSAVAVANLLTGNYPESAKRIANYYDSIYSDASVLKEYLDLEYSVFFLEIENKSFSNRQKAVGAEEKRLPIMKRRAMTGLKWTLPDINFFRWMPFALKLRYLRLSELTLPLAGDYSREWELYPVLGESNVDVSGHGTFLFAHTEGVHLPVTLDRHGEQLACQSNNDAGCVEMGVYIMKQLGLLFDKYREKGIYDDSLILVLADHGQQDRLLHFSELSEKFLSGSARPFLWVKAPGNRSEFVSDGTPTSHSKIAGLLRAASQRYFGDRSIRDFLRTEHRLYRKVYEDDGTKEDWVVDRAGEIESYSVALMDEMSIEDILPLVLEHLYPLRAKCLDEYGNAIRYKYLLKRDEGLGWWSFHPYMELSFKVPIPNRTYCVRLRVEVRAPIDNHEKPIVFYQATGREGELNWHYNSEIGEIVIHGLVPDQMGMIQIIGERKDGFLSFVYFPTLTVDVDNTSP